MKSKNEGYTILLGAALGALVGAALAVLFGRWRRQGKGQGAKRLTTGQAVRLGTSLVSVVRQFLDLLT